MACKENNDSRNIKNMEVVHTFLVINEPKVDYVALLGEQRGEN